jgi:hypothetical protein
MPYTSNLGSASKPLRANVDLLLLRCIMFVRLH